MPGRRLARAITVSVVSVLLLAPSAAWAQVVDPPPPIDELKASEPWTMWLAKAGLVLGVITVLAFVVGYLVKGREFQSNAKRGGAK